MKTDIAINWLLEPSDPSIRYRTLIELLDVSPSDREAVSAHKAIGTSAPVAKLFEMMHPEGYWIQTNPGTHRAVGEGTEYGSFATTHFCLAYLSELGLDRKYPKVALTAERYLNLQQQDGDWYRHFSCLYGYNIRTFLMLGYRADKRLKRSIKLLTEMVRQDGGYLCDMHEGKSTVKRSCIRGSLKALAAFSELGLEYWKHDSCRQLVGYFLERDGIYKKRSPKQPVNRDVETMVFPFHWRAGLVEVLYHLSRMGYGNDPRLVRAWALLETKKSKEGKYILEWTPTQSPWKVGKRGMENKWMTLYARLGIEECRHS